MNVKSHDQSGSTPAGASPNYELFKPIEGCDAKLSCLRCCLSYLGGLDLAALALVLTMTTLATVGVCAVWPFREIHPAGAVAAGCACAIAGVVGLVVILTRRGTNCAKATKTQEHASRDP